MTKNRGRRPTFNLEARRQLAQLVERYGIRGALEASTIPVSNVTLIKIAREFGIQLYRGRRPAEANEATLPQLREFQTAQLRQVVVAGPRAAGYRSDRWTHRRIKDVVHDCCGVKVATNHVPDLLKGLGLRLNKYQVAVPITGECRARTFAAERASSSAA